MRVKVNRMRMQVIRRCLSSSASLVDTAKTPSRLPPLPSIAEVIRLYKLRALRQLSQNFLMEPRLHDKIVKAAGSIDGCHVCEVGPGPGGITRSILEKGAAKVIVVEKDERFMPSLELLADAADDRLSIHVGDIRHFDFANVFPKELTREWNQDPPPIHVIGNLPFNVSTFLIIKWLRDMSHRRGLFAYGRVKLTLTFQKEVAERMVAPILSPQRCRLSVMCQHLCHVKHKFTISGKAFLPKPEVDVGVVHFVPRVDKLIPLPIEVVEKFFRHIFHCRRKNCKFGVETLFPKTKQDRLTEELFELAVVDFTTKAYELTMEDLDRMCRAYNEICQRDPTIFPFDYRARKTLDQLDYLDENGAGLN